MAQIPQFLEQLIQEGKAVAKSLSMAACQQLVIPVPQNTYIVVYGYDYLPMAPDAFIDSQIRFFDYLVQYVTFVNNGNFYPFNHHLSYNAQGTNQLGINVLARANGHESRETYIIAKSDLSVYFTKLVTGSNMILNSDILQPEGPIFNLLGYANQSAVTEIIHYNTGASARDLQPLTSKYTVPQYAAQQTAFNQAYTVPGENGQLNMSLLQLATQPARARANHINIYYVEINQQAPPNII